MKAILTSSLGGQVKIDGKRLPAKLPETNGLLKCIKETWINDSKVMIISGSPAYYDKNDSISFCLKKYQHKGYGRKAVELALDFIRTLPCGSAECCWLSYEPENTVAKNLYASFGFSETGDMDGEEIIAALKL